MARDENWYRRTTWTPEDQAAFFQRNRRSRGPDSKAQYMRIQAETLRETGDKSLIGAGLELLEQSFRDYPNAMDCAQAYECAARCCESLGRIEEAITYFRKAIQREREFPGIGTNACFRFGKLVVKQGQSDLFDEVVAAIDRFGHPVFPWHAYFGYGTKAVVAYARQEKESARELAQAALKAAGVKDSGLGSGRGNIGIVGETDTVFHGRLLAAAGG
jgi:tetratricopeptide (TPR) repeat protein